MNNIIEAIDKFIYNRMYRYALLINGKWGCGKTFFVQKELIPHIKKKGKKDVNYLSLYGIRSTEEISQMLCVQAVKDKMGKVGNASETKGGQIVTFLITGVTKFGLGKFGADNTDLQKLIEILPDYSNNVVIFDDLERCCCEISEVLGYINNFVEHSDAAVIIVANEEEIGKWQLDRNPEMQLLVALDKRIDVEVEPTKKEHIQALVRGSGNSKDSKRESYTLEQLDQRRKAVFHCNENYRRIKEKVIGQTINYEPDLNVVFTAIIEVHTKGAFHDLLLSMRNDFVNIAEKEQHANLRTFQFFLEKASAILSLADGYEPLHEPIIEYCYLSCVRYMKGNNLPVWDGDYGYQILDKKAPFSSSIMGFKFIDDLITKNQIDEEYVLGVLAQFTRITEKKGQFSDDPYQKIRNWFYLSDEELSDSLVDIEQNIRCGKYSTELYSSLINILANLKSYNIMTDQCDKVLVAMKDYIRNADAEDLQELESEHFMNEGEARKIYKEFRAEIEEQINAKKKQSEKQMFEETLNKDNWGTELHGLVSGSNTIRGHSFIYWLDPKAIANKIAISINSELQELRYAMQRYYDGYTYYEAKGDDFEHLAELRSLLADADKSTCGQIQAQYYHWIIGDIDRYLDKIKPIEVDE